MRLIDPGPSSASWHTEFQNALKCPRYYALSAEARKEQGKQPPPAPPLIKGSLLHVGLAHHYARIKEEQIHHEVIHSGYLTPSEAIHELVEKQPEGHRDAWAEWLPLVDEVLLAYAIYWASENWLVKAVEKEITAEVTDEKRGVTFPYSQRVDLVLQHPQTGSWWFVDHKSTFRINRATGKRYTLSGQFLGYQMLGNAFLGADMGGVLLNMVQWPRKKETPVFSRRAVEAAPYSLDRFKHTLIYARRIVADHEGLDPLLWPGVHHETACMTQYGPCKFYDKCRWGE